eukprot:6897465-Lingulodinium_polyedra.AAC.1
MEKGYSLWKSPLILIDSGASGSDPVRCKGYSGLGKSKCGLGLAFAPSTRRKRMCFSSKPPA